MKVEISEPLTAIDLNFLLPSIQNVLLVVLSKSRSELWSVDGCVGVVEWNLEC